MIDTESLIKVYRGWDKLEKPNGISIIDFDLIPPIEGERFSSRQEVLERLVHLHSQIKPTNAQEEFIEAKVNAGIYFLRALMGEGIPYSEYVEAITGVRPQMIPEQDVQRQVSIMHNRMRDFDYDPTKGSFERFALGLRVSKEDAQKEVRDCEDRLMPIVLKALGFEGLELPYRVSFEVEDDYWRGWTSTSDGQLLLRYNFHPNIIWYKGDTETTTLHEVGGHFVQAANLRRGIAEGRIDHFIGLTTVQEPHTFAGEGTADALLYFLPEVEDALSPHGLLSRDQRAARDYLYNNAQIMVNEGGSLDEAVRYVVKNHPFSAEKTVHDDLVRCMTNPARRAYFYIYGISRYKHEEFRQRLTPQQQIEYLRYAMLTYNTPKNLFAFVEQLANQRK